MFVKSFLTRSTLQKDPDSRYESHKNYALVEEFGCQNKDDIVKLLEYGAELWMILKKVQSTACKRSETVQGNQGDSGTHLREQFEAAHDFFISRVEDHNKNNPNMFSKILNILNAGEARSRVNKAKYTLNKSQIE